MIEYRITYSDQCKTNRQVMIGLRKGADVIGAARAKIDSIPHVFGPANIIRIDELTERGMTAKTVFQA